MITLSIIFLFLASSPCKSNPCYRGRCYESGNDYYCACEDGFGGIQCNIRKTLFVPTFILLYEKQFEYDYRERTV